jgi:hypothetical protein
MVCNRSYGQPATGTTVVPVRIDLADPAAVEAQYQGLQALHAKRAKLTELNGIGQAAYTYIDKSIGPQLALYDRNVYLTIGAVPVTPTTRTDASTLLVLAQVAQTILAKLTIRIGH